MDDDIQKRVLEIKNITSLHNCQKDVIDWISSLKSTNAIYSLPTNGGKTLIAELLMIQELVVHKRNVLFILPFVSLVQEKLKSLAILSIHFDFLCEEYAGSRGTYPPIKRRKKNTVYVATFEKAASLVHSYLSEKRQAEVGLVVVDEVHMLGDPGRGAILEATLIKILLGLPSSRVIAMSATLRNMQEIATFLKANSYVNHHRTSELSEYIKVNDIVYSLVRDQHRKVCKLSDIEALKQLDRDDVTSLLLETFPAQQVIIFCPTKKQCETLCENICKVIYNAGSTICERVLGSKEVSLRRISLLEAMRQDPGDSDTKTTSICRILNKAIRFGIAYHHAGLMQEERSYLEDAYLSGVLRCLICTTTLATGVNLPAKRIIIRAPYSGRSFLTSSQYRQMAGRAGRSGFAPEAEGECILMVSESEALKAKEIATSPIEMCLSALDTHDTQGLKILFLNLISVSLIESPRSLRNCLRMSLFYIQQGEEAMETLLRTTLDYLLNEELVVPQEARDNKITSSTKLKVSLLGEAVIHGGIDPNLAHCLYRDLSNARKCLVLNTVLHLLHLVTPYNVNEYIRMDASVLLERYIRLSESDCHVANALGITDPIIVSLRCGNAPLEDSELYLFLTRFYATLILYDLWRGTPVWDVSNNFGIARGSIQTLMTSSASFSFGVYRFCTRLEEFWAYQDLLVNFSRRLAFCSSVELLPLLELPGIGPSRATQLQKAGFGCLAKITEATPLALSSAVPFLSSRQAGHIINAARIVVREKVDTMEMQMMEFLGPVTICAVDGKTFNSAT